MSVKIVQIILLASFIFALPAVNRALHPRMQLVNITSNVIVGAEYCFSGMANALKEVGCSAAKYYPDVYCWPKMQSSPNATIDFTFTDAFVSEYQKAEVKTLMITLKAHCSSASSNNWPIVSTSNFSPKKEYLPLFETYVKAVVERYDHDGIDDMPGLLYPVRYYEIGEEFSSYEPESAVDYINNMLLPAYNAAHAVYDDVIILHAALFVPNVWNSNSTQRTYEAEYEVATAYYKRTKHNKILIHSYSQLQQLITTQNGYDAFNFHSLLYPTEIPVMVQWIRSISQNASKAIVISDTAVTPYISFGNAVNCKAFNKGLIFPPAKEEDRCRLANYFSNLLANDSSSINWVHTFCAADTIKRMMFAAVANVELINLAYTEDLYNPFLNPLLKNIMAAGAGNTIWAGFFSTKVNFFSPVQRRKVTSWRAVSYAINRLVALWEDYSSIQLDTYSQHNGDIFIFSLSMRPKKWNNNILYRNLTCFWLEPTSLDLPGDEPQTAHLLLPAYYTNNSTFLQFGLTNATNTLLLYPSKGFISAVATGYPQYIQHSYISDST